MRKAIFAGYCTVVFLFFPVYAYTQSQLFVGKNDSAEQAFELKEIKKIIFNSGKFIVVGNTENEEYSLSDIRYLSFQPLSANHISENKTGTSVLIFPNPVEKEVTVEAQEAITSILLYDINGKIIRQFSSLSSSVTLNLTDLPSGYYLIKIETANVCLIRKIIKK